MGSERPKHPRLSEIALALKRARVAHGWSQAELSRLTGISQANLSQLETGRSDVRLSTLLTLVSALGLELSLGRRAPLSGLSDVAEAPSVLEEMQVLDDELDEEDD